MHDAEMIFLLSLAAIPLAAIVAVTFLLALKILKGRSSKNEHELQADEARQIQEIHRGLLALEQRIEALETLLLEKERQERQHQQDDRDDRTI